MKISFAIRTALLLSCCYLVGAIRETLHLKDLLRMERIPMGKDEEDFSLRIQTDDPPRGEHLVKLHYCRLPHEVPPRSDVTLQRGRDEKEVVISWHRKAKDIQISTSGGWEHIFEDLKYDYRKKSWEHINYFQRARDMSFLSITVPDNEDFVYVKEDDYPF
ncbi:hypothetical protein IE53DRAFT_388516 [Violaceomyces palustris]|uniref:Uncharacterized protein n=1 Tax=Violaceomyces palustris TaxID=1673888 RepID=A0ACD0NU24_9BASI|nr:hypothetical protein IE53DRAFT_388516 [Violaceomyces palustris]